MITPTLRAESRGLHYGEHWTVGIVARLDVHRETIRARVVEHESDGVRREIRLRHLIRRPPVESRHAGERVPGGRAEEPGNRCLPLVLLSRRLSLSNTILSRNSRFVVVCRSVIYQHRLTLPPDGE